MNIIQYLTNMLIYHAPRADVVYSGALPSRVVASSTLPQLFQLELMVIIVLPAVSLRKRAGERDPCRQQGDVFSFVICSTHGTRSIVDPGILGKYRWFMTVRVSRLCKMGCFIGVCLLLRGGRISLRDWAGICWRKVLSGVNR